MSRGPAIPGLGFEVVRAPAEVAPLRTDVVAIIGRTERGPIDRAVRVQGWRAFTRIFGGLDKLASTPHAARGCAANGADEMWVLRLGADDPRTASVAWRPEPEPLPASAYRFVARGPGRWGNELELDIRYRARGVTGRPELDVVVARDTGEREHHAALDVAGWAERVNETSQLVTVVAEPEPDRPVARPAGPLRRHRRWSGLRLTGGELGPPGPDAYAAAIERLARLDEPAIVIAPDLYADLGPSDAAMSMVEHLADVTARAADRLVVLGLPFTVDDPVEAIEWTDRLRLRLEPRQRRCLALYPGQLLVPATDDPVDRLRMVTPVGHVAGQISRLDRERGPHHTPADVALDGAVDVDRLLNRPEEASLHRAQLNPIVPVRGRGVLIRGGRTLDFEADGRFIAHRRLTHRLVRAIRRVVAPLVFEPSTPDLRLSVVRAITTLLLETWRSGGLKGERPDEGFRVRCDDTTTTPADTDTGRVVCEIDIAPAAPMEFICIRLAVGRDGTLEVDT